MELILKQEEKVNGLEEIIQEDSAIIPTLKKAAMIGLTVLVLGTYTLGIPNKGYSQGATIGNQGGRPPAPIVTPNGTPIGYGPNGAVLFPEGSPFGYGINGPAFRYNTPSPSGISAEMQEYYKTLRRSEKLTSAKDGIRLWEQFVKKYPKCPEGHTQLKTWQDRKGKRLYDGQWLTNTEIEQKKYAARKAAEQKKYAARKAAEQRDYLATVENADQITNGNEGITLWTAFLKRYPRHPDGSKQLAIWKDRKNKTLYEGNWFTKKEIIAFERRKMDEEAALEKLKEEAKEKGPRIELVLIRGGCLDKGPTKRGSRICVSDFYIGKYEVTQSQWKAVMGNNPSRFANCGDTCPVENVSWSEVQDFIYELNSLTLQEYRLPTDEEWEYACRSGGRNEEYAGANSINIDTFAWYKSNTSKTQPVGRKESNTLGIYDMSGNVFEWTASCNTENRGGLFLLIKKGGSWASDRDLCRCGRELMGERKERDGATGFRLALTK